MKHPIISEFFVPHYEGTNTPADQMPRVESSDTGCELFHVTSAQILAPRIVDNAELKRKLCEPTAKMRFKSPL